MADNKITVHDLTVADCFLNLRHLLDGDHDVDGIYIEMVEADQHGITITFADESGNTRDFSLGDLDARLDEVTE